jgi:hypothetical protein
MTIESAMFDYLAGQLSIGARTPVPIFPMGKRPQESELPALTYALVAGPSSHYSHGGVSDHAVSYQLDCWAEDADEAMELDLELRSAVDGFRGEWSGFRIGSVFLSTVIDDYEPDTKLYRRLRQLDLHYREPEGS